MSLFSLLCGQLLWSEQYRFGDLLVLPLEQRFQRIDIEPERLTGIIVLTGDDKRLSEAGRLARRYPNLTVLISGAGGLRSVSAELGGGIELSRVVLETRASNTYENALYAAELIRPEAEERWLLVTGALHMPRAIGSFRKVGFQVESWPVYDVNASNSQLAKKALREWLGLFAYRLLGRTTALLPGPLMPTLVGTVSSESMQALNDDPYPWIEPGGHVPCCNSARSR
jgi:uncharacterized SAM-binding protein YcdF (DUF218 family)